MIRKEDMYKGVKGELIRIKGRIDEGVTSEGITSDISHLDFVKEEHYISDFSDYVKYLVIAKHLKDVGLNLTLEIDSDVYSNAYKTGLIRDKGEYLQKVLYYIIDFCLEDEELLKSNDYKINIDTIRSKAVKELDVVIDEFGTFIKE